jgi:hypothetical protein
MYMSKYSRQVD